MSSSELDVLQAAFREAGGKWSTFIIWAKNTFTMGRSDYQRQYEPILYGWPEGGKHHWCGDRDQSDVWQIKKPHKNDLHPTMKPVELVERAIRNSSKPGDVVLDPFGGSGTVSYTHLDVYKRQDLDSVKQRGWRDQNILVVNAEDKRLDYLERELVRRIGERLYGTPRTRHG